MTTQNSQARLVGIIEAINNADDDYDHWSRLDAMTTEDMMREYGLDEEDAVLLRYHTDTALYANYQAYGMCFNRSEAFATTIGEALHQGLDGWSDYQRIVIEAFLADIALAVSTIPEGESKG